MRESRFKVIPFNKCAISERRLPRRYAPRNDLQRIVIANEVKQSQTWIILCLCFLFICSSQASAVSLKIVRPTAGESLTMPIGYTYVIGTVAPADSQVICNGMHCDVDRDGAFIGFVPIRSVQEWSLEKGKTCDVQFEFVARNGSEEFKVLIPAYTPRSPSAAVRAQEIFDPPRIVQTMKDQWIGLENQHLGEVIYIPQGSYLPAKFGGAGKYLCELEDHTEVSIPTVDATLTEQIDPATWMKPFLIMPQQDAHVKILDFLSNSLASELSSPWGLEWAKEKNQIRFYPRLKPDRSDWKKSPLEGIHVCLDPGHNPDPGAIGPRGFEERESTLLLSREIARILEGEGAYVSFTREENPLPLKERYARILELKPDLLMSVHNNSVGDGQDPRMKHGTQTFYLHPWSKPLAESVHQSMLQVLGTTDMGCIRRNLYITRFLECPSILIEPEYIILPEQEKKFMDPDYRHKLAQSIVDGIQNFIEQALRD